MHTDTTRRRFIEILPLGGVALLAACSPKTEPPAPPPAPPAPPPAPEPAVAAPAPAAASEPAAPAAPEPAAPAAPATPAPAAPQGGLPMVDPKDAKALALGYVSDAAQADKVKYPKFVAGSQCANCGLFQGKVGDKAGGCPLFPGNQVAASGWCSAWVKKA